MRWLHWSAKCYAISAIGPLVANAQAALGALMDDRGINLVFTDVMMPGSMNGMDLAIEVKRRWPNLAVLLTTRYAG